MRIRPRASGWVRPALLAPAVVGIVLGVLGMHGVDAHGVNMHGVSMHGVNMDGATAHAQAATSSVAGPAHELVPGHAPVRAGTPPGEHAAGAKHDAGGVDDAAGTSGMAMLCVAMLTGVAAALLAVLVRRGRRRRLWAVLPRAGHVWRPAPHVRGLGTGPPPVWRFSVIRC